MLRLCSCSQPDYLSRVCISPPVISLPFLKERGSDENTYAPCVIETLSLLGSLSVGLTSEPLRQQVAQTVANFYRAESNLARDEGISKML